MLTEIPHRDGSPLSRCRSDAARMGPVCDSVEDETVMSGLSSCSSNKSLSGTPIKILIAHEMSKELDTKHNSPSLVAKLMGLDALPRQESDLAVVPKDHTATPSGYWQKDIKMEMQIPHDLHHSLEQREYKDVYEVFNQSHLTRNTSPQKGMHNENSNEKKMALVREKFIEAKCLAADKKYPQSKRFQEALEVLNTNRDLFVKFLQEPNSLISQQQFDLQSIPPSETKRITVLKPSKLVETNKKIGLQNNEKQTTRASNTGQKVGWDKSNPGFSLPNWRFVDDPTQPTRIVVLKPSTVKLQDIKAVVSPPPLSPGVLHSGDKFLKEPEEDDAEKLSEVNRHQRADTSLSSVCSNGYIGDESSFQKSESGYVLDNLSESEVLSPISRHSWDYVHRVGSPYSTSSLGRASCSPESSVCREAKRRLLERWAVVASNGSCVEQPKHVRRSSSTLGEMLALSDPKNHVLSNDGYNKEHDARGSTSCLINDLNSDEIVNNSPTNLLRSKSAPISATMLENTLNLPEVGKKDTSKEMVKSRSLKTSLKGKVSSFFSKGKRSTKGRANACQSHDESDRSCENASDSTIRGASETINKQGFFHPSQASSNKTPLPVPNGVEAEHCSISPEAELYEPKPIWLGNPNDNQDRPSPILVLGQLFEQDDDIKSVPSKKKLYEHGASILSHSSRSNLIDKSPPIGSISRTLSRDNPCLDRRSDYSLLPSSVPIRTDEGEHEWHFYVESLLSAAGINSEAQSNSYIGRWHSPDSPLDPSLRDRYIDLNEKEIIHEGKRRRIRSTRKLVFDCVNEVMTGHENVSGIPDDGDHQRVSGVELVDRVWSQMREWFSVEVSYDDGDRNSLVLERLVKTEVVGLCWAEHMRIEMDNIGKEIEGNLLEELVHEAVVELTDRLR